MVEIIAIAFHGFWNAALIKMNLLSLKKKISIFHGCMVWIEKSVTRVTDQHHEANSDPE